MTSEIPITPTQLPSTVNPVENVQLPEFPLIIRVAGAALWGYLFHFVVRYAYDTKVAAKPYILKSVCDVVIERLIKKTCSAALGSMGERSLYESPEAIPNRSLKDRLRVGCWKVVRKAENLQKSVDTLFSRILGIRAAHEMPERNIPDVDLRMIEVARAAFLEVAKEIPLSLISHFGSVGILEGMGYALVGMHIQLWITGAMLSAKLIFKISDISMKNDALLSEEQRERMSVREPLLLDRVAGAALFGYLYHFFVRYAWDSKATAKPYILQTVGVVFIESLIKKTCSIGCSIVLGTLGDRSRYESPGAIPHPSFKDHLRARCWKVVKKAENLNKSVDIVFSRILRIRPTHEMPESHLPDDHLKFMEIARASFGMQQKRQPFPLFLLTVVLES